MLGMGTGIDRAQIQATNLGKGIRGVAQEQLQLSMIMDAMTRRFAEVGTPMTTVKELFTQIHMVQGAFIEDMAYSLTHSAAFANGIETVSKWLMKATPVVLEFAKSVGEKLGVAFEYLRPLIVQFWKGLTSAWTIVDQVAVSIGKLSDLMDKLGGSTDATSKKISAFGKIAHLLGEAFAPMILSLAQVASSLTLVNDLFDAATSHSMAKAEKAWKAAGERTKQNVKDFHDAFKPQEEPKEGKAEPGKGGPHVDVTPIDPSILNQRRQLALQIATEQAKIRLETALQELHDEEDALKEALALWESRERTRAEILTAVDAAEGSLIDGGLVITERSMQDLAERRRRPRGCTRYCNARGAARHSSAGALRRRRRGCVKRFFPWRAGRR